MLLFGMSFGSLTFLDKFSCKNLSGFLIMIKFCDSWCSLLYKRIFLWSYINICISPSKRAGRGLKILGSFLFLMKVKKSFYIVVLYIQGEGEFDMSLHCKCTAGVNLRKCAKLKIGEVLVGTFNSFLMANPTTSVNVP
jgi:hypothetical protein